MKKIQGDPYSLGEFQRQFKDTFDEICKFSLGEVGQNVTQFNKMG